MRKFTRIISTFVALVFLVLAGGGCTKAARRDRQIARADALFQAQQYDKAEPEYIAAYRMTRPPSMVALRQLGLLYAEQGRPGPAYSCLQQAATAEPANVEVQVKLATVCQSIGRTADAKAAALQALKVQPGNEQALMVLCELVHTPQDLEQIRQYVLKLSQQDKDRSGYHLAMGVLTARLNNLAAADTELNKALALNPKSSLTYLAMANVALARTNNVKADEAFKNAIQLAPVRSPARIIYADFLFQTGAVAKSRELLRDLTAKAPDYMPALMMQMNLSFRERKWDECNSFINQILGRESGNFEALYQKGAVSLAKDDPKQAIADYERMNTLTTSPMPQVQYQLATAYLRAGNKNKAVASLNFALTLNSNLIPAKLMLADLQIRQGDASVATAMLSQLLKQPLPENVTSEASLLLARAYLAQKNTEAALAIYHRMEAQYPKESQVPWLAGNAYLTERRIPEAREEFNRVLALNPDSPLAMEELVNLDLMENNFAAAMARVEKQISRDEKAALPRLVQAKVYIIQNDRPKAEAALQKAIELNPNLPTPYLLLAKLYTESKEYPAALAKLNALVNKTNDISALMEIGQIHDQLKEYDPARDSYEKLLQIQPRFSGALNNLAYLYSQVYSNLDRAYELAEKDRELAPYDPYVADTLGWILFKRGEYGRALALLEESADKQPGDAEVNYHVGMAHYMMGEADPARLSLQIAVSKNDFPGKEDAQRRMAILSIDPQKATPAVKADLEKQIEKDPSDPIALARLAAIQERDGEYEKAASTLETIVKKNSQDARAMARLAQLYANRLHQPAKALELAKNAQKVASEDQYVTATLGRLVFQARDYPYALTLLQSAARGLTDQPDLQHDLAWAYYAVGKVPEAETAMQQAAQSTAPFASSSDAKRFLAMVAATKSAAQAAASAPAVNEVLRTDTNYVPALAAAAFIQEVQGQAKEAERLYENVLVTYPLFAPASRELAILYERDGDDAKAFAAAQKARAAFPDDLDLARSFGIVSYRKKDYSRSLQLLSQAAPKFRADPALYFYMGMDYYQTKKTTDSKANLQKALELKVPETFATDARRVLAELK